MQQKYITYYTLMTFHKWFQNIQAHIGDAPFQSVVQNFLYYPDPDNPKQSRLESFVLGLAKLQEDLSEIPDPEVTPKSFQIKGVTVDETRSQPRVDDYVGDAGSSEPAESRV